MDEALDYYKKAIELDPANSVILYNTGILFNIRSEYEEAVKSLELSINKNPENVYAYLALGDAYERQNEIQKALQVFKDLRGLGIKVHGLKEKIQYLEQLLQQNQRKERTRQHKEQEQNIRLLRQKEEERLQQLKKEELQNRR